MGSTIYPSIGELADLKSWLGGPTATTDDALLTTLLGAASQDLQSAVSRNMAGVPTSYTEYYTVPISQQVVLRQQPVTELTSVQIVSGYGWPRASQHTLNIQVSATPQSGYAYMIENLLCLPPVLRPNTRIQVVYTAGFDAIPTDFYQAVLELAGLRYRARNRIGENSKNLGGEVVAYNTKRWNNFIEDIVCRYRLRSFS